ncbi:MAG TPA: cytochrome c, partial [Chitinophagaceae bacterium]|nr:cytochrome c [Chitinophagaceae bacterium]
MNQRRKFSSRAIAGILFFLFLSIQNLSFALDGQAIYKTYCASCHKPDADFTGPRLKGAREREPSKDWVYKWVGHVDEMLETDPYAKQLFVRFNSKMTAFPDLTKEEIDAVLDWANAYQKPGAPSQGGQPAPVEDNSLLYGLLTLILGVIGLILLQVNSNLKKLSDE